MVMLELRSTLIGRINVEHLSIGSLVVRHRRAAVHSLARFDLRDLCV